jgi:hypothetical protein
MELSPYRLVMARQHYCLTIISYFQIIRSRLKIGLSTSKLASAIALFIFRVIAEAVS